MAREVVKRKGKVRRFEDSLTSTATPAPKEGTDLESVLSHVRGNPLWYAGAVAFIALAVLAGVLFRVGTTAAQQEAASAYARALGEEDPELRLSALEKLPADGALAAEITYMIGETAYEAGNHERAQEAFEKVRSQYPDSAFVADALEGLGYIAEDAAEYEQALAYYQEAAALEGTFAAQRQPFNIGRVHEKLGNLEAAVEAYRDQPLKFPDSTIAANADAALSRLRESHPELFPEAETAATDDATAPATESAAEAPAGVAAPAPAPAEEPQAEPEVSVEAEEEAGAEETPTAEEPTAEEAPVEPEAGEGEDAGAAEAPSGSGA